MPATVVSRISGNALFVPVDSAQIGTSPHPRATIRCVPSPPRTTIARTPAATIRSTAIALSRAVPSSATSSSSSTGNGAAPSNARTVPRAWRWRCSVVDRPSAAGSMRTRSTPAAPNPARSRKTIPALSALPNTDAPATRRRMSRPDAGLAMTPTVTTAVDPIRRVPTAEGPRLEPAEHRRGARRIAAVLRAILVDAAGYRRASFAGPAGWLLVPVLRGDLAVSLALVMRRGLVVVGAVGQHPGLLAARHVRHGGRLLFGML